MNFNKKEENLRFKLYKEFCDADDKWITRKRKITTSCIFNTITQCSLKKRGLQHILNQNNISLSATALSKARKKIPCELFKDINKKIQPKSKSRIFAIDGSKVHVPPSFINDGFVSRTNNKPVPRPAKRPIVMLSSLLDVERKTCYDFELTKHFNERESAKIMIRRSVRENDIVIFDRGYYSKELLYELHKKKAIGIFRLKINAFKECKAFFENKLAKKQHLGIYVDEERKRIPVKLIKYYIDSKKYICLVNDNKLDINKIQNLYKKRWQVELSFKRLKSILNLENIRSLTPTSFLQEIEIRILIDTISLLLKKYNLLLNSEKKDSSLLYFLDTYIIILSSMFHFESLKKIYVQKFKINKRE